MPHLKKASALRCRRAATAVEFALILPIYLGVFLALIETAILFADALLLESAAREAARTIRTGQASLSGSPLTVFKTRLCEQPMIAVSCEDLVFRVQSAETFGDLSRSSLFDAEGNPVANSVVPGDPGDRIIATAGFSWAFLTPLVGELLSGEPTGVVPIWSTVVLRNEPFPKTPEA